MGWHASCPFQPRIPLPLEYKLLAEGGAALLSPVSAQHGDKSHISREGGSEGAWLPQVVRGTPPALNVQLATGQKHRSWLVNMSEIEFLGILS